MNFYEHYVIQQNSKGYTFILYLNSQNEEYSQELDSCKDVSNTNFFIDLKNFINVKFPNLKINIIKVVAGTTIICSIPFGTVLASSGNYTVKSGDTLWKIANQYGISVDNLKNHNNLESDLIIVGQNLKIPDYSSSVINVSINGDLISISPDPVIINGSTYLPIRGITEALGGSVWWNSESKTIGINKDDVNIAFVIDSSVARINGKQVSMLPSQMVNNTTYVPIRFLADAFGLNIEWNGNTNTVSIFESHEELYTIVAGDTLWGVAQKFSTSVESIKSVNNLSSDTIYVGQILTIPVNTVTVPEVSQDLSSEPTITYITHTVAQGDNVWNLSIQYGIPMTELLAVNNLNINSSLSLGQQLQIPVHNVPISPVISENHGELLDWWTEAQFVFAINDVAKVTDFETGISFYVKRTIGANHADCEPLTANDAAIIKNVWGGSYSWSSRAVIVEVDGRKIAASMASMPHNIQYIADNNFNGHFDIHFLNSTRHSDGLITESHQTQIHIAAGY